MLDIDLANPTFSGTSCTASLTATSQSSLSTVTFAGVSVLPCHNGMVMRTVITPGNTILVYIDNTLYMDVFAGGTWGLPPAQPGIAIDSAPSGNGITAVAIGHFDAIAPNAISSVTASPFRDRVDLQWSPTTDNSIGTGGYNYVVLRNSTAIGETTTTAFQDFTAGSTGTYTYTVQAVDFHGNATGTTKNVTMSTSIDPRETGVRPLGSYWGAAGEQIDMLSGNVNYTIPIIRAMARGGKGVSFQLGYNSQNWRQDTAGTWQLGLDTGYGYGWHLQAGSLTPLYNSSWTVAGFLFIDSTGAEYLLNTYNNNNGGWISQEGIYLTQYSTVTGGFQVSPWTLNFPDGSRWIFNCFSGGTEQDAGTAYPTEIEDSNGTWFS
jgi:hypothetical protein